MFLFRHFLRRSILNLQEFVAAARKGDERTNKRRGRNVNWRGSETSQRHKKKRHRNFALSTGCFHYITVNDRVADLPFFRAFADKCLAASFVPNSAPRFITSRWEKEIRYFLMEKGEEKCSLPSPTHCIFGVYSLENCLSLEIKLGGTTKGSGGLK